MALKFKVKAKEEIPAEHVALYAERKGVWVLDVDGAVEKAKLDDFRNTNVALLKERDELKKRFEGIDPDQVRALADEKRKLEEEKLLNGAPHRPSPQRGEGEDRKDRRSSRRCAQGRPGQTGFCANERARWAECAVGCDSD